MAMILAVLAPLSNGSDKFRAAIFGTHFTARPNRRKKPPTSPSVIDQIVVD
jgi:hypothetical protein